MTRRVEALALASLALALAVLGAGIASRANPVDATEAPWLDALGDALAAAQLRRRGDVVIEINEREVGGGFVRGGCDGLLLVAPLPRTAQGWRHVAPRLDLAGYSLAYAYDGALYQRVPRLRRLGDRLLAELRGSGLAPQQRVVALAERGGCDLMRAAAALLPTVPGPRRAAS